MFETISMLGKTFEELIALFFCEVGDDDDYYDVIAYHLASQYRQQLEGMLHLLSTSRLRAAICGLGLAGGETEQSNIVANYLGHSDPIVVSAAIDALRRTGAKNWSQVSHLLQHDSPYIRGAALRYCKVALGTESATWLLAALKDPDAIVRENALDELEGIADHSMVSLITNLLQDPTASVRQAAETLLTSMNNGDKATSPRFQ